MDWMRQGLVKDEAPLRLLEKASRLQKRRGGKEKKKKRRKTDGCDLCLTPQGILATDNLIQLSA